MSMDLLRPLDWWPEGTLQCSVRCGLFTQDDQGRLHSSFLLSVVHGGLFRKSSSSQDIRKP